MDAMNFQLLSWIWSLVIQVLLILAGHCGSFNSTEETALDLDGGTGHKKPPRKGRKKLQAAQDNQAAAIVEQDRSDHAASESKVDDKTGMNCSFSREAKRHSVSIDEDALMDGSRICPGSINYSAGVMSASKRRTMSIAVEGLQPSDDLETAYRVTANMGISCRVAQTCGEFSKGSIAGQEKPCDSVEYPKPGQVSDCRISTKDAPVPLATKVFHLQRNNRLRAVLNHLYFEASTYSSDSLSLKVVQGSVVLPSQDSSPKNSLHDKMDDLLQRKKDTSALHAARKPDQILAQSSELCLGNSNGHPAITSISNQFWDNNFSRPGISVDASPMGMIRGRYLSAPYSFPGNSGTSLGTMQQPDGSVPVI
ncbi:SCA7 domain-containing protein SELMODRAFT_431321-like [Macadamia integrifolia]|uniref:SCA7 domain-containing protein SELMODRAFT_431321-like n=1 Tax=Macadamia integrifolia TaxID=60698 RepID=UPI001C528BB6|nr:SCA7 domain-containing protein SELMODRAFT_431321-like [Macadamia integrifolia]